MIKKLTNCVYVELFRDETVLFFVSRHKEVGINKLLGQFKTKIN